jgi:hypothetical protein
LASPRFAVRRSKPTGAAGGACPRSLRLARRPASGRRGPTRLRSLSAMLARQGQAPAGRQSLGHPPATSSGSPPYPLRWKWAHWQRGTLDTVIGRQSDQRNRASHLGLPFPRGQANGIRSTTRCSHRTGAAGRW